MIGIQEIASFIPENRRPNSDLKEKFEIDDTFISEKIGISKVSIKDPKDEASDLCVKAFRNLEKKINIVPDTIECLFVVTQNPDYNIPHTSAIVHGKLDLPESCACFDISLGCSGYVYGLSVIKSFMIQNQMKNGLLFTADPYSKIINKEDKNTSILFGDGASVTLISSNPIVQIGNFTFGTIGKDYENLICQDDKLFMNGRAIFNFAARYIPKDIPDLLRKNNLEMDDIDLFIFHQGSKYIVDTITKRLKLDKSKVPFKIDEYGNTISSSIPILLEDELHNPKIKNMVVSGFGVGLSWSSAVIRKIS